MGFDYPVSGRTPVFGLGSSKDNPKGNRKLPDYRRTESVFEKFAWKDCLIIFLIVNDENVWSDNRQKQELSHDKNIDL